MGVGVRYDCLLLSSSAGSWKLFLSNRKMFSVFSERIVCKYKCIHNLTKFYYVEEIVSFIYVIYSTWLQKFERNEILCWHLSWNKWGWASLNFISSFTGATKEYYHKYMMIFVYFPNIYTRIKVCKVIIFDMVMYISCGPWIYEISKNKKTLWSMPSKNCLMLSIFYTQ